MKYLILILMIELLSCNGTQKNGFDISIRNELDNSDSFKYKISLNVIMANNVPYTFSEFNSEDTFCIFKNNVQISKRIQTVGDKIGFNWKIGTKNFQSRMGILIPSGVEAKIYVTMNRSNKNFILSNWQINTNKAAISGIDTLNF